MNSNKYRLRSLVLAVVILVSVLLVPQLVTQVVTPAQPQPGTNEAIYALIETLRPRAAQIQIDGKGEDWEGIPAFTDPADDAQGDSSRDIVKVAIAPRENDLLVLMATAGKPSQERHAFWLDVDLMGRGVTDIQLGLARQGGHIVWIYLEDRSQWVRGSISGLQGAIDDVVEVKIPYAALEKALPTEMARLLTARSWARVSPFTKPADPFSRDITDFGAAVASYRLIPTPYPLDPSFPVPSEPPMAIDLPLQGKWYISAGALIGGTHAGWSYDFCVVDHTLSSSRVRQSDGSYSNRNEDYYCWEQPIVAPRAAKVLRVVNDQPDATPPSMGPTTVCNSVLLDLGSNVGLFLCHLRKGSVTVPEGEEIPPGKVVGLVGNSGLSTGPHLHMEFRKLPEGRGFLGTLPMALTDVRVSLNFQADDPWTREWASWEPREGFFVERMKR